MGAERCFLLLLFVLSYSRAMKGAALHQNSVRPTPCLFPLCLQKSCSLEDGGGKKVEINPLPPSLPPPVVGLNPICGVGCSTWDQAPLQDKEE